MGELTRREVVQGIMAMFGGGMLLDVDGFLARYGDEARTKARGGVGSFTRDDVALLDEVADTILPTTSTPGAKAAQTGTFMALMVTDSYSDANQQVFRDGLKALDDRCQAMHGHGFMASSPAERLALLEVLDREQYDYQKQKTGEQPTHYFRLVKGLAMQGYFTSEIGYTQALRYEETPGRFDPCVPYQPGEKAWASHA